MTRLAVLFAAATAIVAAPALGATYAAKPSQTPAAKKIIGKDISWTCANGSCSGATESSRPLVLCQDLAKKAGHLDSFLVDGQALAEGDLAKCNTSAKGGASAALARN